MKTPWFNAATQNPVRVGVYEVKFAGSYSIWHSRWNGKFWCSCSPWIEYAAIDKDKSGWIYEGCAKWRGLTKEAK